MKKIIIILALLFSGIMANAQITTAKIVNVLGNTRETTVFKLGEYVFTADMFIEHRFNSDFPEDVDGKEVLELRRFIEGNKGKIEEKYGVVIDNVSFDYGNRTMSLKVYTTDEYEAYMAAKQAENNAREQAKEKRLGSIL